MVHSDLCIYPVLIEVGHLSHCHNVYTGNINGDQQIPLRFRNEHLSELAKLLTKCRSLTKKDINSKNNYKEEFQSEG